MILIKSYIFFFNMIANNPYTAVPNQFNNLNIYEYGVNKTIPKIMEESILIALSHYPELKETKINFVFKQDIKKSVMQAQPILGSLLVGKEGRAYQINISSMFKLTHSAMPIHQLPKGILIGWIGHELGHIMDFESRSTFGLIKFGFGYLFSERYLKQAEVIADTYAVNHGLGEYIVQTKRFILNQSDLPEIYKARIARLYLSPDDIVDQIRKLEKAKADAQQVH